jgi:outer membrane lipoprotein LolB
MRLLLSILIAVVLMFDITACSTMEQATPPADINWKQRKNTQNNLKNWELNGKLAIQTATDSTSATLHWLQNDDQFKISLFGPLGTLGLTLYGDRLGTVTLETANGHRYTANSPEQLLQQQANLPIPISNLYYWIRGLPVPNIPAEHTFDRYHRITKLVQQGIEIQFISYTTVGGISLPDKILITNPGFRVKIIIYQWNISSLSH